MSGEASGRSGELPARRRNFSPWYQWMRRLGETVADDPLPDGELSGFDRWKSRCTDRLAALLGRWPEAVELNLETTGSVRCDGYRRDSVVFDTEQDMSVPALLLVPDGPRRPGPAVLAVHGHGPGKAAICGLAPPGDGGVFAHQLAQQGYVVLAPDLRCFGERADWNPPDHYGCDTNLVHAVMAGWNPLTQNLWDLARSLDVLGGLDQVDPARLAVVGHSYGATLALFLAALDPRVAAAVVSGYLSSWAEAHRLPWNMCGSQILAGQLGRLEHADVAALVAPRPLLVVSGTEDLAFPLAAARDTVARLQAVYAWMGHPESLVHHVFAGSHEWHEEGVGDFLGRALGQGRG